MKEEEKEKGRSLMNVSHQIIADTFSLGALLLEVSDPLSKADQ